MKLTLKLAIPRKLNKRAGQLNREFARVYNKVVSLLRKVRRKKGFWLQRKSVSKYILRWGKHIPLAAQTKQAAIEEYYRAFYSYLATRDKREKARPPYRRKKFLPCVWKSAAIYIRNDCISFSNGLGGDPFVVPISPSLSRCLQKLDVKIAKLVYNDKEDRYYIHLVVEVDGRGRRAEGRVVAVDLGVIHPIVAFDGEEVRIWNGGELNAKLQYRNKRLASIWSAQSKLKKGSRKWKRLERAKKRMLRKIRNQVRDILHKTTSSFLKWVEGKDTACVLLGDLEGVREGKKFSKKSNQKLRDWTFRRVSNMVEYKARLCGIDVEYVSERYTSQTCPICGNRRRVSGRDYRCPKCGFEYHRDGVGAINIWRKYLGYGQVVADLAPAVGVRYNPHLRGHGHSLWKLALSQ